MLSSNALNLRLEKIKYAAFKKKWEMCSQISSETIFLGCGPNASLALYRYWMESLKGLSDFSGLVSLSRHILSQRRSNFECVPLALLASCYSGRKLYASKIFESIASQELSSRSALSWEARFVYLCNFGSAKERKETLRKFGKFVKNPTSQYLTVLNYAHFCLENDLFQEASEAFSLLKARFPLADDCERMLANCALAERDYKTASILLSELHSSNSSDCETILNLATSLAYSNELLSARDLLNKSSALFDPNDYGFNILNAWVSENLYTKFGLQEQKLNAVRGYSKALLASIKLGIPEGSIHLALGRLQAGYTSQAFVNLRPYSKMTTVSQANLYKDSKYWLLSCSDEVMRGILNLENPLVRIPVGLAQNEVVFVSRRMNPNSEVIVGLFRADSMTVPDSELGRACLFSSFKAFDVPIEIEKMDDVQSAKDLWGCANFSMQSRAEFYELPQSVVQWIVLKSEDSSWTTSGEEMAEAV
jgi:tetratricopeptide (TPR) repeat protein